MSTVVYHGLPAFLESQHNESRTLRLKLASPRSHLSHSLEMAICTVLDSDSTILLRENSLNNGDHPRPRFDSPSAEPSSKPQLAGLSFLQTLPTIVQTPNEKYVHPLVKRASSALSDKSLELCTENLGSETGTDIMEDENSIFFPICPNADNGKIHPRKSYTSSSRRSAPKKFPPPLSTIMGSEAVCVRPIREDGRLILQAVKVQPRASCFQADRSNGRLRLCYSATDEKPINSARDDTVNDEEDLDHGSNNSSDSEGRNEQQDIPDSSTDEKDMGTWEGRCKEGGGVGNSVGLSVDSESRWPVAASSS